MGKKSILNLSSLKDQVYEYLRGQMKNGELRPGDLVDMNATSKKLGISKTPLRDALIQLEMEGFVSILPRRGVVVNDLTIQDIKDYYQILGALESTALLAAAGSLHESQIKKMIRLNESMRKAIQADDFATYYEKNLAFHDVYLSRAGNDMLRKTVEILKKRLYDFPRREGYLRKWEENSILEHERLIALLAAGDLPAAANFIRDVHWSYSVQEKYIQQYYEVSSQKET